jgi:3-oxoacyl-[acyl-carrier protein] reductase
MIIDLSGKTAIVCGSSKGIGREIAIQFAKSGANVVLLARDKNLLDELICLLDISKGNKHHVLQADLQEYESLSFKLNGLIQRIGKIDIVVNNSGGPSPGPLVDSKIDEFIFAFERHLFASQIILQSVLPKMKEQKWGRFINIISYTVKQPRENLGVSNTLRGAMASWSKTLSRELAPFGITMNNILPGFINTERLKNLNQVNMDNLGLDWDAFSKVLSLEVPAARLGKPEELSYLATFLASDYANYINGTNIQVDGGLLKSI